MLATDFTDMRVLVVDDNVNSCTIMGDILQSFNVSVDTVASGQAALAAVAAQAVGQTEKPYKLVFMDWKMPTMNGLETAQLIKQRCAPSPPSIILVTGYGQDDLMRESTRGYIDGFILKPVYPSLLLDAMMTVFGQCDLQHSTRKQPMVRDVNAINGILGAQVLLAEDNKFNQQVASELLANNGLIVTVCNNGKEAVAAAANGNFDIILMDIQMPEMDGFQATRLIRNMPHFKTKPIIALTAHAMTGDREKSLQFGMDDHITKPINPELLFDALVKWIPAKNRSAANKNLQKIPQLVHQSTPTTSQLPDSLPGIMIQTGLKHVGGNAQLFKKLLRQFYEDYRDIVVTLRTELKQGNAEAGVRICHTLKGIAGSIGALSLADAARKLEIAIKGNLLAQSVTLLDQLGDELQPIFLGLSLLQPDRQIATSNCDVAAAQFTPSNPEQTALLFADLAGLLKSRLSKAASKLSEIQQQVSDPQHLQTLHEIEELIADYEHEDALTILHKLSESMNISVP